MFEQRFIPFIVIDQDFRRYSNFGFVIMCLGLNRPGLSPLGLGIDNSKQKIFCANNDKISVDFGFFEYAQFKSGLFSSWDKPFSVFSP